MIRQDYIIRMVEQFAELLATVIRLSKEGKHAESQKEIRQAAEEVVGLDLAAVCAMSDNALIVRLIKGVPIQEAREKCFMLVALLNEAATDFSRQVDDENTTRCRVKALNLSLAIRNFIDEAAIPLFAPRVEDLLMQLSEDALPPQTLVGLMQYFELMGELGRAEDYLFELIKGSENRHAAIELGYTFFHRQSAKADEELLRGNLPRAEVEAGLKELEKMFATTSKSL